MNAFNCNQGRACKGPCHCLNALHRVPSLSDQASEATEVQLPMWLKVFIALVIGAIALDLLGLFAAGQI